MGRGEAEKLMKTLTTLTFHINSQSKQFIENNQLTPLWCACDGLTLLKQHLVIPPDYQLSVAFPTLRGVKNFPPPTANLSLQTINASTDRRHSLVTYECHASCLNCKWRQYVLLSSIFRTQTIMNQWDSGV